MARSPVLQVRLRPELLSSIDQMRGARSRSDFVRDLLEVAVCASATRSPSTAPAQQAERSAPIVEVAPPAPVEREFFLLPPVGQPDAHGWHYRWEPRSATVGTLRIGRAGQEWRAVDLIGVELENLAGGQCKLSYADRSLVRVEESES